MTTTEHIAESLLVEAWELALPRFWQICPKEMIGRLEFPLSDEQVGEAQRA